MAPTLEQVMLGIEARLATVTDQLGEPLRVAEYIKDSILPPFAVVGVPPVDYHATFKPSSMRLDFPVTVLVSASLDRIGQLKLAGYANPSGSTSVREAIEGDKTLGGILGDCIVMSFRPLGIEEVGLIGYYGGVFTVRAISTT